LALLEASATSFSVPQKLLKSLLGLVQYAMAQQDIRYYLNGLLMVVEEGQLRRAPAGRRLAVRPEYDAAVTKDVKRFFDQYACVAFENYGAEPVA